MKKVFLFVLFCLFASNFIAAAPALVTSSIQNTTTNPFYWSDLDVSRTTTNYSIVLQTPQFSECFWGANNTEKPSCAKTILQSSNYDYGKVVVGMNLSNAENAETLETAGDLPPGLKITFGTGTSTYNLSMSNDRTNPDFEMWASAGIDNLLLDGNIYPSSPNVGNITFPVLTAPFVNGTQTSFSSCSVYAYARTFGAPRWVEFDVSSNGTDYITIYNITGTTTNDSWIPIASHLSANTKKLYFRAIVYATDSGGRFLEQNGAFGLNCTLANSTPVSFQLTPVNSVDWHFFNQDNLTASFVAGTNNSFKANVSLSYFSEPTTIFRMYNSVTNATLQTAVLNLTSGGQSVEKSTTSGIYGGLNFLNTELWSGSTVWKLLATGYNTTNGTITLDNSTPSIVSLGVAPANLNVYVYDELDYSLINVTIAISNTTDTTTFSDVQNISVSYASIPNGAVTITVSNDTGYYQRLYYSTINANTGLNLNAYLVPIGTYSSFIRFHIQGNTQAGISGARVSARKFIGGGYVAVGQQDTDASGIAGMFLNIQTNYQIVVEATGYNTLSELITPAVSDYYLTLSSGGGAGFPQLWDNFTANLTPTYFESTPELQEVSFWVTDYNGTLTAAWLDLYYSNGSLLYSANLSGSPSGGQLSVFVNTTKISPYIFAVGTVLKSGLANWTTNRTILTMADYGDGNYSWTAAVDAVNDSDVSPLGRGFIVLFLSILSASMVSRMAPPGYGGLIAVFFLTFFSGMFEGLAGALIVGSIAGAVWFLYSRLLAGR